MKLQLNVTMNKEAIEKFWDEYPIYRTFDHNAKLPPYEACVVREMSTAVKFDGIGLVTAATLVLEPRRALTEAFHDVEEALYAICKGVDRA